MKVLVCGGRTFGRDLAEDDPLYAKKQREKQFGLNMLHALLDKSTNVVIVSGMAKGGDMIGVEYAKEMGLPTEEFPISQADWKRYGNSAGPRRNQIMLNTSKPDWVIAFPGGNGTKHMCTIAEKEGILVKRIVYNESQGTLDV